MNEARFIKKGHTLVQFLERTCKFKRWGRKLQPVGTNGNNCKLQMRWRRKAFVKALED